MSSLPLDAFTASTGFASDPRFAAGAAPPPASDQQAQAPDPVELAWADGYDQGRAEALAEAEARMAGDEAARARIELSLARLDADLAEQLRQKLHATVEALCEAAIAPLALDPAALAARVERAAAMLARADDARLLRLHPDDLPLVAARLPEGLEVLPDPALERGALRIESTAGGVEDGPSHWRRAIAEALAGC